MTQLRTERLLLRPARPDDLAALHAIFSDPRAMRYWDRPAYDDIAETQKFLTGFMSADMDKREEYILDLDGRCIGKAGIWAKPDLGYILHPEYWGQGLAVEAARAILPRAFARWPDMPKITAELDPRNTGSIRVLEKLGFRQTGFAEKNFRYGDDEWTDTAYYALDRPVRTARSAP